MSPSTTGWYWIAPRVAVVLVVIAVGALLWLLHRQDREDQRRQLIEDILWVNQDFAFQLNKLQEVLDNLGRDVAEGRLSAEAFDSRVRLLSAQSPWLMQVIWYDPTPAIVQALPPGIGEYAVGEAIGAVPSLQTFVLARSLGNPVYSPPYPAVGEDHHIELHVPQFREGALAAMMVGIVSLKTLLQKEVPWWYAERYQLRVVDADGTVLAAKSKVGGGADTPYLIPFDPPGRGLALAASPYKTETNLLRNGLAAAIVLLTLGVLASLWALRRHVQRRLRAEGALRDEYAFRKAMEDSMLTGLRARDLNGRITYVNRAFCDMVGWPEHELVGCDAPMPYWPPEELPAIEAAQRRVLGGESAREGMELRLMRRNGERFDALVYEAPLIDARGRHAGWMGSVLDISARKRAEELYRQQQEKLQLTARLVTMGEMASTLAHELNQPLSAISSYNAGCLNRLEAGGENRTEIVAALRKLGHQAQRAGQIVRRIYDFVRRSEPRLGRCALNDVVEDAIGLIEPECRKRAVRVHPELSGELPTVLADPIMIEQVVLNLMRNAMDAVRDEDESRRQLRISTQRDNDMIRISIADRGVGISETVAGRLFTPFFTTKDDGMGMGLNICRSIVELHKGRLWFERIEAGGTVFHVSLPVSSP